MVKVKTGGGDNNKSSTQFFPQIVEIKTGRSVTWYNPTRVPEPHTVTFQMGSLYPIQSFLPVELSKSAQFQRFCHRLILTANQLSCLDKITQFS